MGKVGIVFGDLPANDGTGRTIKEENAAKTYNIPIGTLVEIAETGCRLFIVDQGRDCDMTPLYWLSHDKDYIAELQARGTLPTLAERMKWIGGYCERSLVAIQ